MILFIVIILISFLVICLKFGIILTAGTIEYKQNQKLNSDLNNAKAIWRDRVNELGIQINSCIDVLFYDDEKMLSGQHRLMWYDGNKLRWFLTPETVGKGLPSNPKHWTINSYNKGDVVDVQKKSDCCVFSLSYTHCYCDINDYDKLYTLIEKVKS